MKSFLLFVFLFSFSSQGLAGPKLDWDIYGKVNLSYAWRDMNDDARDNASRIGVKGSLALSDSVSVVYQLEQGVDLAHGGTELNTLLSTRNSYLGIKGGYGTLFFGSYDTPLKAVQGKVDRFSDQQGDLKTLFVGEVRARDAIGYHSPNWEGWELAAMYVPKDAFFNASQSISVVYELEVWTFGVAVDHDMRKNDRSVARTEVYDSVRGSVEYGSGPWRFGLSAQQSEQQNVINADKNRGYLVSLGYTQGKTTFSAQRGLSDIVQQNGSSTSVGLAHKWQANFTTYVNYWRETDGELSLGFELKF